MKRVRENSFAAWHAGRTELFSEREQQILQAMRHLGAALDREVLEHLGYVDMNSVRPRITELIRDGVLEEVRDVADPTTGKTVRVLRLTTQPPAPVPMAQLALL